MEIMYMHTGRNCERMMEREAQNQMKRYEKVFFFIIKFLTSNHHQQQHHHHHDIMQYGYIANE